MVKYSYPIPTLERDKALAILQPALMQGGFIRADVLARGGMKSETWIIR
jgi:hypothetical protein